MTYATSISIILTTTASLINPNNYNIHKLIIAGTVFSYISIVLAFLLLRISYLVILDDARIKTDNNRNWYEKGVYKISTIL